MENTVVKNLLKNMAFCLVAGGMLAACGGNDTQGPVASGASLLADGEACNAAWVGTTAYVGGNKVSYSGRNYTAAYWTQNNNPSTNSGPSGSGQPWITGYLCGGATTTTKATTTTTKASTTTTKATTTTTKATTTTTVAGARVQLYQHCNYTGWSASLGAGSHNTAAIQAAGGVNNDASSLRIPAGYQATLYDNDNYSGSTVTLTGDVSCLVSNSFNDILSSMVLSPIVGSASFDVTAISVTNAAGQAPVKGDAIRLNITVRNNGTGSGTATVTPRISSSRFSDFSSVNLPSASVTVAAGQQAQVSVNAGPFVQDATTQKRYALGRGSYTINNVGINGSNDASFSGNSFTIGSSNTVFVPVLYDQTYLNQINYTQGIGQYMSSAFTRPSEVFTLSGTYQSHTGGFDQMMGVRQIFYPVSGFSASSAAGGFCEQATASARTMLGLAQDWAGPTQTNGQNHGFDYLISLTPALGGGAACGWLGVQVSGLFSFDLSLNRAQIMMVHESGHLYGAPHCDPLQSYVMCAGELHTHYKNQGLFVWHIDSRNLMSNRFD